MSKYHNTFQGFVKLFTGAAKRGEKSNPTTIIGIAPSKNIKKFQKQKEKIIKMTDSYKKKVNDPEVKKKMNETTSKTLGKISNILKGEKVKKAMGGRIGRKFGSPNPKKTNIQKIKETFGPKKKVPNKFKGFSKLPEAVQEQMNKKLAKKV